MPGSPGAAWDEELSGKLAADALNWLAEWFPECSGSSGSKRAHGGCRRSSRGREHARYRGALRSLCQAGRDEALRIRRGAA
jgi:hypothetical protein